MWHDPLFEKVAKIIDPEDKLSGGDIIKLVEEKFTSDNTERDVNCCETCAESQKGYINKCFNWPECSLTYDKWKKGNNYGDLNKKLEK